MTARALRARAVMHSWYCMASSERVSINRQTKYVKYVTAAALFAAAVISPTLGPGP
jgi:hypothetical protein